MPDLISQFQKAGFSDQEIGQWSQGFRQQMTQAGFSDDEVSRYLDGGVTVPQSAPKAFLNRLVGGDAIRRVNSAIGRGASEGFGPEPIGSGAEALMREAGMISDPANGTPGPLRTITDAVNKPIAIAADVVGRAFNAGVHGIGAALGQYSQEAGAASTTGERVEQETENFLNYLPLHSPMGMHVSRPEVGPTGVISDLPIGGLPESEDFGHAANVITAGETVQPPSVQRKILQLYSEEGVHPAEVAHDAASDPTVAQSIVSRGTDLPDRYTGAPAVERLPAQPQRLNSWIVKNGGVQDTGGDISQSLGGPRSRPALINNRTGMTLDDAALKAWEDGFFPGDARPSVNDLLDAIDEDHNRNPRYSGIDAEAVATYQGALARNSEVERLAEQHGIDPRGMSRDQFWDTVASRMSEDDRAHEAAQMGQAHEDAFAEAEARTRAWFEARGEAWEPDQLYRGVPASLEDLENAEHAEGEARWQRYIAEIGGEGEGGAEAAGAAGRAEGNVEAGARPGGVVPEPEPGATGEPGPAATGTERRPVGFTTAKGSTYEINSDGTTTRNKSYHPEHGEADQGPQPRSETTFYLTPEQAKILGEFQAQGAGRRAIEPLRDGRWGIKYLEGKDAGKFEARTVVTPETTPREGLVPVELWSNGTRAHFGNNITELTEEPGASAGTGIGRPVAPHVEGLPATVYRGFGREEKGSVYNVGQIPILGPGKYFALTSEAAKEFGPEIEELETKFADPLVIRSGQEWNALTKRAGWPFPNPFGRDPALLSADIGKLNDLLRSEGHDAVAILWNDADPHDIDLATGADIKLLRTVFDRPQVFVPEAAEASATPRTDLTDQGEQIVMPGMERSAQHAMEAREAEGRGMMQPTVRQAEPGGLFAKPEPEESDLFGPERGAIRNPFAAKKPPAPGSFEEAEDSILSKLSIGEPAPRRPWTLSRIYTNVFEKLYPISEVTPAGIPTERNPYRLTRLLAGLARKIDHFLEHGTYDFNTYQINGESLKSVLDPVKDDLDGFRAFGAAARGLELEARGLTTGLDLAAMQRVVREGIDKYEPVLTGLVDYQNRVASYLRDGGVLSRAGYDAMVEANRLYVPFQRVMGDGDGFHGAGQGLQASNPVKRIIGSEREIVDPIESIIRNTAAMVTMAEKNAAGVKLIDMLTAAGETGFGEHVPIRAIELPPDPVLDAALRDFLTRNGVKEPEGLLDLLHAAATAPDDRGTISIFRDGTRSTYQVNPELALAWKRLDAQTASAIETIMRPFAQTLRAGAVLTPDFAMRHTVRDYLYAAVTSPGLFSPVDMARGFMGLISKDEPYWRWVQGGGANISMVTVDRRYLQEDIARLTQQTGLVTRMMNTVADPNAGWLSKGGAVVGLPFQAVGKYILRPLQVLTELAENASHLGAYMKAENAAVASGEEISKALIQESAFASRDVAVDAARSGARTRAYNMIVAFANITLQDTDRVVRAFANNPYRTTMAVGAGIVLPSALLWLYQHDDPRYHEIPQWQRDLAWVVLTDKWEDAGPAGQYGPPAPGTPYRVQGDRLQVNNGAIFRIPKPWGMGVLFGTGTELALEAFMADNPASFRHFLTSISNVVIPQLVPTAIGPILNQWTNRDTFTNRTLIPDRLEKLLPEYQYTPYTTEATKALGKIIGAFPGLRETSISPDSPWAGGVARALSSPILLENYIRGWTGTLGVYALQTADLALRKAGMLPDPPKPTAALADIPVVRAFIVRYPSATTQSIQDFEDAYSRNKVFYDTWLAKAKEGDMGAVQRIQAAGGLEMFVRLDGIQKSLSEHNKLIQDIYRNPISSPSDKRQLIDTLYYRMIELGQAGKAAMATAEKALSGPQARQ